MTVRQPARATATHHEWRCSSRPQERAWTLPLRPRLAVLIDAENINASHAPTLVSRIAPLGRATVRRAYGDWTHARLTPWKALLGPLAIRPRKGFTHFSNGSSMSAAGSVFVMDAMELIYVGCVDGICILSSNSDFIALATRIKQTGLLAYDFGQRGTHPAWVAACSEFVWVDAPGQVH